MVASDKEMGTPAQKRPKKRGRPKKQPPDVVYATPESASDLRPANDERISYSTRERQIGREACRRYGVGAAPQFMESVWDVSKPMPARRTLYNWLYDEKIVIAPEVVQLWDEDQRMRLLKVQSYAYAPLESIGQAILTAAKRGESLKVQQFAMGYGILYDKVVPKTLQDRTSVAAGDLTGEGAVSAGPQVIQPWAVMNPDEMEAKAGQELIEAESSVVMSEEVLGPELPPNHSAGEQK